MISQRPSPPQSTDPAPGASRPRKAVSHEDAPPSGDALVLIVDDEADNRELLQAVLQFEGFRTTAAKNGAEAVQAFESESPDVVLLDLELPDENGIDVARRLRQTPTGKSVLLVALTGANDPADRQATKAAGFDAHIGKPVEMERLLKLIRTGPAPQKPHDTARLS